MPESDGYVLLTDLPVAGLPITASQARRWRFEKRVPSYLIGGKVAFKYSELIAWIEGTRVDAQPEHEILRRGGQLVGSS